eukprot:Colp12_sorted_trinity150504_noHs@34453
MAEENTFAWDRHVKYFKRCLQVLPTEYASLDSNRMTICFFALSALDLMDKLSALSEEEKKAIIEWIYSCQVQPYDNEVESGRCGFRGGNFLGQPYDPFAEKGQKINFDSGHLAMTYTALACLLMLNDDLSRVNRKAITTSLKHLQDKDGSFSATPGGGEKDIRFVYCACCISYMLDDWSGVDKDLAAKYIMSTQAYDYAFGQTPEMEGHGGSTFCGVAALVLMDKLNEYMPEASRQKLLLWCLNRQQGGFQGRPNKPEDTCYSFWVGATIKLLDGFKFVDHDENARWLYSCQSKYGGFSKWPDTYPDALHAYFGVCGFSLMDMHGLQSLHAALNISKRAAARITKSH